MTRCLLATTRGVFFGVSKAIAPYSRVSEIDASLIFEVRKRIFIYVSFKSYFIAIASKIQDTFGTSQPSNWRAQLERVSFFGVRPWRGYGRADFYSSLAAVPIPTTK
jgi:hypothetical protein